MLIQGSPGDFHAYMAAKEIPDPLALTQPGDHAVEPGLEKPDLSSVIDGHLHLELAVLDSSLSGTQGLDGFGDGAGGDDGEDEAGRERQRADEDQWASQPDPPGRREAYRGADDDDNGHGRPQGPGQQQPPLESEPPRRRGLSGQSEGEHGRVVPLHQQEGERRGHQPAERDVRTVAQTVGGVVAETEVQTDEQDRGPEPPGEDPPTLHPREVEHRGNLLGIWLATLVDPAERAIRAPAR